MCPIQPICSNLDSDFSRPSQNRDSGCVGAYQQTEIATRVNKELSLTPGLSDPKAHGLTHCCSGEKRNIVLNIRYQQFRQTLHFHTFVKNKMFCFELLQLLIYF